MEEEEERLKTKNEARHCEDVEEKREKSFLPFPFCILCILRKEIIKLEEVLHGVNRKISATPRAWSILHSKIEKLLFEKNLASVYELDGKRR